MKRKRPLRNTAERQFEEMMMSAGWEVFKRGMPDFACYKDGKFRLVEVKPGGFRFFTKYQYRLLSKLASLGVPCYYWSAETRKFTRVPGDST